MALADPAADWPCCLIALGASVRIVGRERRARGARRRFHSGLLRDDADHRRHHHGLRHPGAERAAALGLRQGGAQERRLRQFDRHRRRAQGKDGPVVGGARRRGPAPPSADRDRQPACDDADSIGRDSCAPPSPRTSTPISRTSTPIRSGCTPRTSCMPRGTCGPNDCDHHRIERREDQRRGRAAPDAGRFPARPLRADRDASGLRARRLRRLHGGGGRHGDALMPDARRDVRRPRGADARRAAQRSGDGRCCAGISTRATRCNAASARRAC